MAKQPIIPIDHGSIVVGEESIILSQGDNEIFLRYSEMETLIETYSRYKKQKSVDKSVQEYLKKTSKRVNPDAPGNCSYLYD